MLVGRRIQFDACRTALEDAVAGRGQLVAVSGEAGIGKTELARSLTESAVELGAVARWGGCRESDPTIFGVWLDALRWPRDDWCDAVVDLLERAPIAHLDRGSVDEASVAAERLRLLEDVANALGDAASDVPQMLVLEDLHWADESSLELLRAVTTKLPMMKLLVLVTCRSDEVSMSSLGVGGSILHIELEGLGVDGVAALLERTQGRPPTKDRAAEIHSRTGGNPLFVNEVARLAATGSMKAVPTGVREVLGRRMAHLSASCYRLLGLAAVAGSEIDEPALAQAADVEPAAVRAALAEAVTAQLVVEGEIGVGGRRFAHELIRAAREQALGAEERAQLHGRWLDLLDSTGAAAGRCHFHAARAELPAADDRLSRLALHAGHEAAAMFAWQDAKRYYREALSCAPPGATGSALRGEAWLGLGSVRLRLGGDAAEAFVAAAEAGRSLETPDLVARAALGFGAGFGGFEVRLLDRRQVDLLEEAAAVLSEGHPLRPLVLARLSVALSFVGSAEKRLTLADRAIDMARSHDDDGCLVAGLAARCDALAGPDHVDDRLRMSSAIIDVAERCDDTRMELLGMRLRIVALLEARALNRFDAEVSRYEAAAGSLGDDLYTWWSRLWRAARAHAAGRFGQSHELRAEALAMGLAGGSRNADLLCLIGELFQAVDEADADEIEAAWSGIVQRHPDLFHQEVGIDGIRALVAARSGDVTSCRATIASLGSEALDQLPRDQEWLTVVAQYLTAAVVASDDAVTRRAYELLSPYEGLGAFEGAAAVDRGVVDRFLATAASALGDAAAARRHAEAALLGNADAGELLLEQTRADAAIALLAGSAEDLVRARELGEEAVAGFAALGLTAHAQALSLRLDGGAGGGPRSDRQRGALVRDGDSWAISYAGRSIHIRHAKGIANLATLLRAPGREVHVRDLEGVHGVVVPTGGDAVLDAKAVSQYRSRLRDIEVELDEANAYSDSARAEKLAWERGALVDELTRAFGLGGRARTAGSDPDERLRKAVSARIRASIDRIEDLHPALGNHLRHAVKTGARCCYDPEEAITWRVDTSRSA